MTVAEFARDGVPYSELLYQRFYGGAFRQLQDESRLVGVAAALRGGAAWFGVALSASLIFILTESLEFILAERMQERRAEPTEQG